MKFNKKKSFKRNRQQLKTKQKQYNVRESKQ